MKGAVVAMKSRSLVQKPEQHRVDDVRMPRADVAMGLARVVAVRRRRRCVAGPDAGVAAVRPRSLQQRPMAVMVAVMMMLTVMDLDIVVVVRMDVTEIRTRVA